MIPSNTSTSSSRPTGKGKDVLRTTNPATQAPANQSHKLFDARSLAGSMYESYESYDSCDSCSSDGKTPTLSNTPRLPSAGGGSSGATAPPRCPSRPRGIVLEQWTMTQMLDKEVLDILRKSIKIGARKMSIFEAARPGLGASASEQPPYELAVALHNSLRESKISIQQKRSLFTNLNWKFECFACGEIKSPETFGTSFHLWGPKKNGPKPRLRSGPCLQCVNEMRECDNPDSIIPTDVYLPPECINRV